MRFWPRNVPTSPPATSRTPATRRCPRAEQDQGAADHQANEAVGTRPGVRKRSFASAVLLEDRADLVGDREAEPPMGFRAEVQAVHAVRRRDAARVEKVRTGGTRDGLVVRSRVAPISRCRSRRRRRETFGFRHRRRRDDKDLRRRVFRPGRAILRLDDIDRAFESPAAISSGVRSKAVFMSFVPSMMTTRSSGRCEATAAGRYALPSNPAPVSSGTAGSARSVVRPFRASSTIA